MLKISNFNDQDKRYYDSGCNIHFHKNEEAKTHGKIYLEIKNAETKTAVFKTKENPALMQTLYRHKTTYLSNIGNTYTHEPLAFPLALCGVNVIQAQYDDPRCLCGVGCCSPYGMIDESDTKQLNDIFPQFDLEKANKQNEEKIV